MIQFTYPCVTEAFTKEDDFSDVPRVWDDHGDGTEHRLEVIGKLRTTSVSWDVKI